MILANCTEKNLNRLAVSDKFVYKSKDEISVYLILKVVHHEKHINLELKLIKTNRPDYNYPISSIIDFNLIKEKYKDNSAVPFKVHYIQFSLKKRINKLLEI